MSWQEIAAFLAVLLAAMVVLGWAAAFVKNALAYFVLRAARAVRRGLAWRLAWRRFAAEYEPEFAGLDGGAP